MKSHTEIENRFKQIGATFLMPADTLALRLQSIRAFVFDWDGVFNLGAKGDGAQSTFSEPDSMGTNLLRYAYWQTHGVLPVCAIVSGASNPSAQQFAVREHFQAIYSGYLDKTNAFDSFGSEFDIRRDQMAYVFDDINDFSAAVGCALRFIVKRSASPLLHEYVAVHGMADYVTAVEAGSFPVREIAEMLIGLYGKFDSVVSSRAAFDAEYASYFEQRQRLETAIHRAPK